MPSDAKKKRDAEKKAAAKNRSSKKPEATKNGTVTPPENGTQFQMTDPVIDEAVAKLERVELDNAKARAVAGVLEVGYII